ncbi:polyprenyl synthetase [Nocardia terpenica]|uniref:Polyprenyl synthetase n=2 Tax=Nocardia terpenica TaxID=455432 RepID=A0A164IZC6_9NOCA|nr:polyprenyl synthetase [Nocardia terpenica]NQE91249.1 polyprenyl synthetase family protein [Nocardia terpenica]
MTTLTAAGASASPEHRPAEILALTRRIVEPPLRSAVESMPEPLRRMASYHLGWCDAQGVPVRANVGKLFRPALAICACIACGGKPESAAPAAVAAELVHNFTLIHDDVMDGDRTRRGRSTVWALWGVSDAVLLGDGLHALAAEVLVARLADPVVGPALDRLESTVIELCRGQHEDCLAADSRRSLADCERTAMSKTGALMGCACALGALCAGASAEMVSSMDRFGRELGMAFQLTDDLIGIWGDPAISGKPADDLAHRKYTMPVVAALLSGTAAAAELGLLYRDPAPLSSGRVARAAELIDAAGGRRWAREQAERRTESALRCLPDGSAADDLAVLARLVARRDL